MALIQQAPRLFGKPALRLFTATQKVNASSSPNGFSFDNPVDLLNSGTHLKIGGTTPKSGTVPPKSERVVTLE